MAIADFISTIMDAAVKGTLYGISIILCVLCLISIWKWFLGVVARVLFYLFPSLETLVNRKGGSK